MSLVNNEQAAKYGISLNELESLAVGKFCPVYGTTETLHVRRTRGGKVTVFALSNRARNEKISASKSGNKKLVEAA